MTHDADPYVQKRALWRTLRRMTRWTLVQARMLAFLGMLARPGAASRWLARRLGGIEHGLRCLLVIALSSGKSDHIPPDTASASAAGERAGMGGCAGFGRRRRFGLSLKALGYPAPAPTLADRTVPARELSVGADTTGDPSGINLSPVAALEDRFAAILSVLEDTPVHVARMARHLARLGLRVRRRPPVIPAGRPAPLNPALPEWGQPRSDIAYADTS